MALTGSSEFLAIADSAALITLFRCVCSLLTGYSLASPYSACLLELALWLNCSILFNSKMPPWSLLQCPVYNGKERQRCCGLCFQGLVKAWLLLYSSDPSLDAEAGGAFKTSPSPKTNKQTAIEKIKYIQMTVWISVVCINEKGSDLQAGSSSEQLIKSSSQGVFLFRIQSSWLPLCFVTF